MNRLPRRRSSAGRRRVRTGVALALLAAGVPAAGQDAATEAPAPAEAAAPAPPQAIPLSQIEPSAEKVEQSLREITEHTSPDADVVAIAEALPEKTQRLRGDSKALPALIAERFSLDEVAESETLWSGYRTAVAAWQETLTGRIEALEADLTALEPLRARWQATLESARQGDAPPATLERVRETLAAIEAGRAQVTERRNAVLELQSAVSASEQIVEASLADLRAARAELHGHLLEPDGSPIWTVLGRLGTQGTHFSAVSAALARDFENAVEFAGQARGRFALQGLLFVAALAGALALRRRTQPQGTGDAERSEASHLVERPYSIALLASLLSSPFLYPLSPRLLLDSMGLLALIPLLRLLPPLVDRSFHPFVYVLVWLRIADQLRGFTEPAPILERVLFALELAAAVGALWWLMRPARLREIPPGVRLHGAIVVAVRVLFAAWALSFVGSLLGYVTLTRLVGEASLRSAYVAMLSYAGFRVASAMVRPVLHTQAARAVRMIRGRGERIEHALRRVFAAGALLFWGHLTLRLFAVLDVATESVSAGLSAELSVGAIAVSLGDVLLFALAIASAFYLSRLIRFVLEEDVYPRASVSVGASHAISTLVHYSVLVLGFLFALAAAGVELGRFAILAGAFGVGLGFGLQNIVNNFVSGLILLFERPVQVGDVIEAGGLLGEVRGIGIRASVVRTFDGAEVIVPNGNLISDQVINWTRSDRERRIILPVGVAYGTDPERVLTLLIEAAKANPNVIAYPEPQALFDGFGDSSLDFLLRVWVRNFDVFLATKSELAVAVNAALAQANIEIPFPQRDLHLRSVDAEAGAALKQGRGPGGAPPASSADRENR